VDLAEVEHDLRRARGGASGAERLGHGVADAGRNPEVELADDRDHRPPAFAMHLHIHQHGDSLSDAPARR
jgi:hypothetical protein